MTTRFLLLWWILLECFTSLNAQDYIPVASAQGIYQQYSGGEYGGGVSFVDWNRDGWDDITFCENSGIVKLYVNQEGTFVNVPFPYVYQTESKMATWVDFDNDGDRDLFVTRKWNSPLLFRNDNGVSFVNVSASAGFYQGTNWMSYGHSWGDYDRDGYLDVYICNYNGIGFNFPTETNHLYHNNGDGTFTDVTTATGTGNGSLFTFQATWIDVDHDLWPDLFLATDRTCTSCYNYLYHNNGDGTFTDISVSANLDDIFFSMNASGGDYDNDGDLDIYVTNNLSGNKLYKNLGNNTFIENAAAAGVSVYQHTWAAHFFDYDNDSWQDLHVCSSIFGVVSSQNKLFKNMGNGSFENVTVAAGMEGDVGNSHSSALGDFNNDGKYDILIGKDAPTYWSQLWQNVVPNGYKYLKVQLSGTLSNIDGVGAWITCYAGGNSYVRFTTCGEGYLSQNSTSKIFGLGGIEVVDSLVVEWPSGFIDAWYGIESNQSLTLTEGGSVDVNIAYTGSPEFCEGQSIVLDAGDFETYLWNDSDTSRYRTITANGLYYATVTNSFGMVFQSDSVVVTVYPNPSITEDITHVDCYGDCSGSVELLNTSGSQISSLLWNGAPTESLSVQNLCGNETYNYSIVDVHGCQATGEIFIQQPGSPLEFSIDQGEILCHGDLAAIDCEVIGGSPPYTWNSGGTGNYPGGNYVFSVSDSHGCVSETAVNLVEPAYLYVTLSTQDASLAFGPGTAWVEVEGGTPPYSFLWSTGATDSIITSLSQGLFSVLVKDFHECSHESFFSILYNNVGENVNASPGIYPNPAQLFICIDGVVTASQGSSLEYEIFNRIGARVASGMLNSSVIDIASLAEGHYLFCIKSEEQVFIPIPFIKIP